MSTRGQGTDAWLSRWRQGTCPIHGVGLVADEGIAPEIHKEEGDESDEQGVAVHCPREDCTLRAVQWPGKDKWHSFFGWLDGPEDIHAALGKAGDIAPEGPRPGAHARTVRTSWRLAETDDD